MAFSYSNKVIYKSYQETSACGQDTKSSTILSMILRE